MQNWTVRRQCLRASFRKRTGRKPSADEMQDLCIRLLVRQEETTEEGERVPYKSAFWRAVGDVIDQAVDEELRQERHQLAMSRRGHILRAGIRSHTYAMAVPDLPSIRQMRQDRKLERNNQDNAPDEMPALTLALFE